VDSRVIERLANALHPAIRGLQEEWRIVAALDALNSRDGF
jgi:hypothetical protein